MAAAAAALMRRPLADDVRIKFVDQRPTTSCWILWCRRCVRMWSERVVVVFSCWAAHPFGISRGQYRIFIYSVNGGIVVVLRATGLIVRFLQHIHLCCLLSEMCQVSRERRDTTSSFRLFVRWIEKEIAFGHLSTH